MKTPSWSLRSRRLPADTVKEQTASVTGFWDRVRFVISQCLPIGFKPESSERPTDLDRLKWLTLCAMRESTGSDVAVIQKRDLFTEVPAGAGDAPDQVQQILDRLIWKGDLLTLIYVPGSAIKKALEQSKSYDREDLAILSLRDQGGRGLEYLGIRYDDEKDEYLINELPIDDKKIYAVATSDYIGAGDTGYPDLAAAALNPRRHPTAFPDTLDPISGVVCRKLYADEASKRCLVPINREKYLDKLATTPVPPHKQRSFGSKLLKLFPFSVPDERETAETTADALQQRVERRPTWNLSLRNFSFGVTSLNSNLSDDEISQKFGGIPTSGIEAKKNRDLVLGLDARITRSAHSHEYFFASGMDYHETITGDSPLNQVANLFTFDTGVIWRWPGRSIPHLASVFSFHTETQFRQPVKTFTLKNEASDSLRISQDRSWMLLPRVGLRWQNRGSTLEVGAQAGRAINALAGYRFDTGGVITECLLDSEKTLGSCIEEESMPPNPTITKDSIASAILQNRPRAGIYWITNFAIPFHSKVKYEFEQKGDFFMVNFHKDNVTDTRFRDLSKHRLSFSIWPSVSIGPALHLMLFQNKINKDFLVQRTFLLETKISFDLFNRREKGVQLRHKP